MQQALLTEAVLRGRVRCGVCLRRCTIAPGRRGFCRTRENRDGKLVTLIDNLVSALACDPIEKKPLYHFYPGTVVCSLGTLGCSFSCPGCQNWQISQHDLVEHDASVSLLTPEDAVRVAQAHRAHGICWTYNEPAIWLEHTLPAARRAKQAGLYTAYVTNGTATREHLDMIGPYLDAYRVDIKAFSREGYRAIAGFANYEEILDSARYARERWDMHVECVTNVTPTINDDDATLAGIAGWIAGTLGVDTPWHVTRFHPYRGFAHLPSTPLARIDRAVELGRAAGLRYIYVGNVPGDDRQDTLCPSCGHTVIRRHGFAVAAMDLRNGQCPQCTTPIAGRW